MSTSDYYLIIGNIYLAAGLAARKEDNIALVFGWIGVGIGLFLH